MSEIMDIEELDKIIEDEEIIEEIEELTYDNEKILYEIKKDIDLKDFNKAEELCIKYKNDKKIQELYVSMLIDLGRIDDAEKICLKFLNYAPIALHYVSILTLQDRIIEAQNICVNYIRRLDFRIKLVSLLIDQNRLETAENICQKNLNNETIALDYILILIKKRRLKDAENICNKYLSKESADSIRPKIEDEKLLQEEYEETLKNNKVESYVETLSKENTKYVNSIYAKFRVNIFNNQDLEELKNNKTLPIYTKEALLLSYYYYKNDKKGLDKEYKNAKKIFEDEESKKKNINKLYGDIKGKKIFDLKTLDKYISWNASRYLEFYVKNEKDKKEKIELERIENERIDKINKEIIKRRKKELEEKKVVENIPKKEPIEEKIIDVKKEPIKKEEIDEIKVKKEINPKPIKIKTISEVYDNELFLLKKNAYIKACTFNYENNRREMEKCISDLDYFELLGDKKINNLKARLQLVQYSKMYDVDISEKLSVENEIYENLLNYKKIKDYGLDSDYLDAISDYINQLLTTVDCNTIYVRKLLFKFSGI